MCFRNGLLLLVRLNVESTTGTIKSRLATREGYQSLGGGAKLFSETAQQLPEE